MIKIRIIVTANPCFDTNLSLRRFITPIAVEIVQTKFTFDTIIKLCNIRLEAVGKKQHQNKTHSQFLV